MTTFWNVTKDSEIIRQWLKNGGVFAYPTEAVYGLGGNPSNQETVEKIISMKVGRSSNKGLIMVAADWEQCDGWIKPLSQQAKQEMWDLGSDRATTFILPAGEKVAPQLCDAKTHRCGLRLSGHPIVQALCKIVGHPIISTSANFSGRPAARSLPELQQYFPNIITIEGDLGDATTPSRIIDWADKKVLRD